MSRELNFLDEIPFALVAFERPLAGVKAEMALQVPLLREGFPAHEARVGPFSRVDAEVDVDGRRGGEALPAVRTGGLALGGRTPVRSEHFAVGEELLANAADFLRDDLVGRRVDGKILPLRERLPTCWAAELLFSRAAGEEQARPVDVTESLSI